MKIKQKRLQNKKKIAVILAATFFLLVGSAAALEAFGVTNWTRNNVENVNNESTDTAEMGTKDSNENNSADQRTPIAKDPTSPDAAKDKAIEQQLQAGSDSKKSVKPIITNSSKSFVSGYVSGVSENGGTCTFTFTSNKTVVRKVNGKPNASTTDCILGNPNLTGDGWNVTLEYESANAYGKSNSSKVN